MRELERGGADCIELGIPFSDPSADGPTIQRSSERALKRPVPLSAIFRLVREFRRSSAVPVILFGYFNPFFRFGLEKFARAAAGAGADGVLCVDLPPEESDELKRWTDAVGIDLIFLLSPTSGPDRVKLVARQGRGFIYYVSDRRNRRAPHFDDSRRQVAGAEADHCRWALGSDFDARASGLDRWLRRAAVVGSALVEKSARQGNQKAKQAGFSSRG
jgi:tryptophan synthase alpha chain